MGKKNFIIIFLIFGLTQNCFAYSSDPKQFITEIVDEAKAVLTNSNSKEIKEKNLEKIAKKVTDIKGIGLYTLGKYRKNLTDEEMVEYELLFEKYFLKSFSSRLSDYSEPKIDVVSAEILNPKYTMVRSVLLSTNKKPALQIDWRVYTKDPQKPLIRDLIVEGLSLARTQKEEFASVIESNDGDINKLFTVLKEFIAK
jgi:phospholipid transport system substrate-binding protein|tara:strand:+ start:847 stop:1440 length:594 start_codon:yes stop_codon:yes gene_type:complete